MKASLPSECTNVPTDLGSCVTAELQERYRGTIPSPAAVQVGQIRSYRYASFSSAWPALGPTDYEMNWLSHGSSRRPETASWRFQPVLPPAVTGSDGSL